MPYGHACDEHLKVAERLSITGYSADLALLCCAANSAAAAAAASSGSAAASAAAASSGSAAAAAAAAAQVCRKTLHGLEVHAPGSC